MLDAGTNLIRLGSLFDVANVNANEETISFTGGHPFVDGDCVYYDPRGGTSVLAAWQGGAQANAGSCTNTATSIDDPVWVFFVRVLDDNTIQLTRTLAAAQAGDATPHTVTVATTTTFLQLSAAVFSALALAVGDAIVYQSPVVVDFVNGVVDITVSGAAPAIGACPTESDSTFRPECGNTIHADNNNIFVGSTIWSQLSAGQAVRYNNLSGVSIGLTNGLTYYVIKGADGVIQLAADYCSAVGTAGNSTRCPATPAGPAGPDGDIPQPVGRSCSPSRPAPGPTAWRPTTRPGSRPPAPTSWPPTWAASSASPASPTRWPASSAPPPSTSTGSTAVPRSRARAGPSPTTSGATPSTPRSSAWSTAGPTTCTRSTPPAPGSRSTATRLGATAITFSSTDRPGTHSIGRVEVDLDTTGSTARTRSSST